MSSELSSTEVPPPIGTDTRPSVSGASHLKGKIGVVELVLTVLAFSAPIVVVSAFIPLVIGYGGSAAPMAFVVAMVLLLLFAVGFTTATRYLPNPGAFYAYITAGLGRTVGLGSSFLAIAGYFLMAVGTYAFFGIASKAVVEPIFHGPELPWQLYSFACLALVGTFGYFRIDLSAKVLSVAMIAECLMVAIFDAGVLIKGGPEGRSFAFMDFGGISAGSLGVAVLFAATCFLGFEATAIFREETKDPRRTVTRATYAAVTFIGLFYIVAAWLIIAAYGAKDATELAATDPTGMFPSAVQHFVGVWASDVVSVLVMTSAFAAVLAVQNIMSRYCYSLGVDSVLPSVLGRVHPTHGSPYVSSLTVTGLLAVAVLLVSGRDPAVTYGQLCGTGGFAVLVLMFLTGIAVVVFFRQRPHINDSTPWHTVVAPLLGTAAFGVVLYLAVTNFTTMTGGSMTVAVILQLVVWSVFLAGIVLARIYRSRRPNTYTKIGRQQIN